MLFCPGVFLPAKHCKPIKNRICGGGCNWTQYNVLQLLLLVNWELLIKSRISGMGAGRESCLWMFFQHDFQPCSGGIKWDDFGKKSASPEFVVIAVLNAYAAAPLEPDWSISRQWSLCIVSYRKCNAFLLSCPFWWMLLCWTLLHYIIVLKY